MVMATRSALAVVTHSPFHGNCYTRSGYGKFARSSPISPSSAFQTLPTAKFGHSMPYLLTQAHSSFTEQPRPAISPLSVTSVLSRPPAKWMWKYSLPMHWGQRPLVRWSATTLYTYTEVPHR